MKRLTRLTAVIAHYASVEGVRAVYLGETDDNGTLAYQFANTGLYLLIAFKFGYVPDFAWLTVTLFAQQGLRIKAPDAPELGAPVTFKVVDRDTAVPVAGPALYAKKIGEISMPKVTSQTIISSTAKAVAAVANPVSASETAVEFEIKESGISLGYTGDNSELTYSFDQSGRYVLVAIKDNYAPGFAKIAVTLATREPLDVKAPRIAMIGEPVTITVVAQGIQLPVSRASVYVLKVGEFLANESIETVVPPEASDADEAVEYAVEVKKAGAFIGYTDDEGKVVHSFIRTGRYALVATKDGYIPGFAQIVITIAGQRALDVVAPGAAAEGRPVTIKAVEGALRWPVEVAGVYALKMRVIAAPAPIENGTDIRITTAEPANLSEAEGYALLAGRTGIFSGYTNGAGEMVHSFAVKPACTSW